MRTLSYMPEHPLHKEGQVNNPETLANKTKQLAEGESRGWENEPRFTTEQIMGAIQEVEGQMTLKVTEQVINHEGVLVGADFRVPGSPRAYEFRLAGEYGRNKTKVTVIGRFEYKSSESNEIDFSTPPEDIAEYRDGAWVRL